MVAGQLTSLRSSGRGQFIARVSGGGGQFIARVSGGGEFDRAALAAGGEEEPGCGEFVANGVASSPSTMGWLRGVTTARCKDRATRRTPVMAQRR